MNFLQKLRAIWININIVQRALLMAVVLAFVAITVLIVYWVRRPDMTMLYQGLDPEDASKITDKINEKNIPYELRAGGTSVYVPKEYVYQLRLDLARESLPGGPQGGYKLFDKEKIGISPFVQNVNLQRALQDELAKSIQMIEGVLNCRVHIVRSEQSFLAPDQNQTSASVVIAIKPGYKLSPANIAAITNLVAGSVEGLKAENVTVVDSQGELLSGKSNQPVAAGASTVQDYKERVEQSLSDKVEQMLTTVLGPGRSIVRVSAVVDMTSLNLVTESYDPTKRVAAKEEITSNSQSEPGTAPAKAGEKPIPGGTKKDEVTVTEYKVGKTVEQKIELPGQIKSLSVAAFVDLTADDPNQAVAGSGLIMQVADVEGIIKNALGLKDTDSLKVVPTKFHRPNQNLASEITGKKLDLVVIARDASLGIAAICALLVLKIFSKARRKAQAQAAVSPEQLAAGEGQALLPAAAESSEPAVLRRQIAGALRSNPEQVRQLFTSLIKEGTE
jgi:flagellar M-ring protein FliF